MADRKEENAREDILKKLEENIKKQSILEYVNSRIISERLFDTVGPYDRPAPKVKSLKTNKYNKCKEEVLLLLGDSHLGQSFSAKETNGLGEYNSQIFKERLDNLENKIFDRIPHHLSRMKGKKILNICLLGDIVHGSNVSGKWNKAYTEMSIYDQIMIGMNEISDFIYRMLNIFDVVKINTMRGNHGRVGDFGAESDYCNWDNILYSMIRERFSNESRVKIEVSDSWFKSIDILGCKFLMIHGDGIAGSSSIFDKLDNARTKISDMSKEYYDYILSGHFHESVKSDSVIINGSFVGGDIYSMKDLMRKSRPSQKIMGIRQGEGVDWMYDINLE